MKTGILSVTKPTTVPDGIEFGGVYLDTEKPKTVLTIPYGMSGQRYRSWRKKNKEILEIIHEK